MTTSSTSRQFWLRFMSAGKRHFQRGQIRDAAQAFTSATQLQPDRVEGWINLGSALVEAKRYGDAVVALQKAIALNPRLMPAHLVLGDALRMLGKWQQAFASYRNAVALQRTPVSLNKLACALRADKKADLAEGLYREAISLDSTFTLAQVNLATLQIELHNFDEAERQLTEIAAQPLSPVMRREVAFAQASMTAHRRLEQPIAALLSGGDTVPLEAALRQASSRGAETDTKLLAALRRYADAARGMDTESIVPASDLPAHWPLLEAVFSMALANSAEEYAGVEAQLRAAPEPDGGLRQARDRAAAIASARTCHLDMTDPVKAELHLRHWHGLACRHLPGIQPGHFKYTQNWIPRNPGLHRVEPALASATFQHFISEIYSALPPGYARAAVVYLAIIDLHLFADANGRMALLWANRELEWAGLMPGLFNKRLGHPKALTQSLAAARAGDLAPMLAAINGAQQYAREICAELAARSGGHGAS